MQRVPRKGKRPAAEPGPFMEIGLQPTGALQERDQAALLNSTASGATLVAEPPRMPDS